MSERGLEAVVTFLFPRSLLLLPSFIFHSKFWICIPAIFPLLCSWLEHGQILIPLMGFSSVWFVWLGFMYFLFFCCWVVSYFLFYFGWCWTEMRWPLICLWQFGAAEAVQAPDGALYCWSVICGWWNLDVTWTLRAVCKVYNKHYQDIQ